MQQTRKPIRIAKDCCSLAAILTAVMLTGCFSLATFQSPKVLERGQTAFGAGAGITTEKLLGTSAFGRVGLSQNLDAGFKLLGVPLSGVFGDVKYQLWENVSYGSLDFGVSYMWGSSTLRSTDWTCLGLHPMVLLGDEKVHGGVKIVCLLDEVEFYPVGLGEKITWSAGAFPVIFVGISIGGRVKVMPEVSISFPSEGNQVWAGLAVQLNTK